MTTPTLTDPRAFNHPRDRQEFFERVMREAPPVRAAFLRRPLFIGRSKAKKLKSEEAQ